MMEKWKIISFSTVLVYIYFYQYIILSIKKCRMYNISSLTLYEKNI